MAEAPKPGTSWQLGFRFASELSVMRRFVSICSDKSSPAEKLLSKGLVSWFFLPKAPSLHSTDRQITKETTGLHWQDALFAPRQKERRTDGVHPMTLQRRESSIQIFCYFQTKY